MDDQAGLTILLVEDMALIRHVLRDRIRDCMPHATVHEAATYDEALHGFEARPVDIAFLDVDLKRRQTGIDVLRWMRDGGQAERHEAGHAVGRNARAVMLSETDDEAVVLECLRLGASGYIHKGVDDDAVFARAVDVVLRGGVFLPQRLTGSGDAAHASAVPGSAASGSLAPGGDIGVTGRLRDALHYLCRGESNKEIARRMDVSESTVANQYVTKLLRAFGVTTRAKLLVEVARRGLIVPAPRDFQDSRSPRGRLGAHADERGTGAG